MKNNIKLIADSKKLYDEEDIDLDYFDAEIKRREDAEIKRLEEQALKDSKSKEEIDETDEKTVISDKDAIDEEAVEEKLIAPDDKSRKNFTTEYDKASQTPYPTEYSQGNLVINETDTPEQKAEKTKKIEQQQKYYNIIQNAKANNGNNDTSNDLWKKYLKLIGTVAYNYVGKIPSAPEKGDLEALSLEPFRRCIVDWNPDMRVEFSTLLVKYLNQYYLNYKKSNESQRATYTEKHKVVKKAPDEKDDKEVVKSVPIKNYDIDQPMSEDDDFTLGDTIAEVAKSTGNGAKAASEILDAAYKYLRTDNEKKAFNYFRKNPDASKKELAIVLKLNNPSRVTTLWQNIIIALLQVLKDRGENQIVKDYRYGLKYRTDATGNILYKNDAEGKAIYDPNTKKKIPLILDEGKSLPEFLEYLKIPLEISEEVIKKLTA